jgi:hypothetical protein
MAHPSKGNPVRDEGFGTAMVSTLKAQISDKTSMLALSRIKVRSPLRPLPKSPALTV